MASVAELLRALGDAVVGAQALANGLGISRATLSRLVAAAGSQVERIGHTRATRYARTREVPGLAVPVSVRRIDARGKPQRVGSLHPLAGRRHLLRYGSRDVLYEGLPPFVEDARPQGFLGGQFSRRHADLQLPPRVDDWSAGDMLVALSERGEDTPGDLILGDASFDRWLAWEPPVARPAEYPRLALEVAEGRVGSSAGGDQPKFTAWNGAQHLLVKYVPAATAGAAALRWRDLVVSEALALQTLQEAGVPASVARVIDQAGMRFLEVERFDRIGKRGRAGVITLGTWVNEFLDRTHPSWTSAAAELRARGELEAEDATRLRFMDVYGALIANSDRHFGNVTLFWDLERRPRLAPAYDMLPMLFAPVGGEVLERTFQPPLPTAANEDVWVPAARWASTFWRRVAKHALVSPGFRSIAQACGAAVDGLRERYAHLSG